MAWPVSWVAGPALTGRPGMTREFFSTLLAGCSEGSLRCATSSPAKALRLHDRGSHNFQGLPEPLCLLVAEVPA